MNVNFSKKISKFLHNFVVATVLHSAKLVRYELPVLVSYISLKPQTKHDSDFTHVLADQTRVETRTTVNLISG